MLNKVSLFIGLLVAHFQVLADKQEIETRYKTIKQDSVWQKVFTDSGSQNWQSNWFADGAKVKVENTAQGMIFTTGDIEYDPAHHGVLWTKQSFSGDIKIEYDYTRLDNEHKWATMLYIQATGTGIGPYARDIAHWSSLRTTPYMKSYFNNMNLLHISYAAFGKEDLGVESDYVRARRYPVLDGGVFNKDTVIGGDVFATGLFKSGETYHVTVIKKQHQLFMEFKNDKQRRLITWDTSQFPLVTEGRIGLRQMWRKSARYSNFVISVRDS